tara:strand:+ start:1319 stop:1744 length:426 start_codon:yes stop_codon:yes gene_type:complete
MQIKIILCVLLSIFAYGKQNFGNLIIDEIVSVYDGDTFKININSNPDVIGKNIPIRINGIDTPEIRTKCNEEKKLGYKAKEFTSSILNNAKAIELKNIKRGKYFRIVADVYVDGKSLSELLIKNNLAVPYNGGTKLKYWCK